MRETFKWRDYEFPKGTRVLLDLYSTDLDERIWDDAHVFRTQRFEDWNGSPFNFIPQGGGDHFHNHRCAGEWITIELMKVAVDFLVHGINYAVPPQDLSIDLSRMPAIPESRFVMSQVEQRDGRPS